MVSSNKVFWYEQIYQFTLPENIAYDLGSNSNFKLRLTFNKETMNLYIDKTKVGTSKFEGIPSALKFCKEGSGIFGELRGSISNIEVNDSPVDMENCSQTWRVPLY